ncbi:MAG: hypothetical protein HYZ71_02590 [Deltaproteobacteria bacterium]|nr:hypothetical protein [Deltaproteobacteria bacterium]
MPNAVLERLVEDAGLVADVGVRLGRIKSVAFLTALSNARHALDNGGASPEVIVELQNLLNSAINDISPITLNDLRAGWRPFDARTEKRLGTIIFGLFCFVLLVSTAYLTQIYDRAGSLYATAVELQGVRGAEQAVKLFGLLRKNQPDVIESLQSGTKDFLYESFNKALFDLQLINVKFQVYPPLAVQVINDLDIYGRLRALFLAPLTWFTGKADVNYANPTNDPRIEALLKNYGEHGPAFPAVQGITAAPPVPLTDLKSLDIQSLLSLYFTNVRNFTSSINVNFDPLVPNDYSYYIYSLREGMSTFGSWILPGLYGMLGAVIFHMRRLLDPSLPNPSWLRFAYRIVLGGFAGIVLVWFWTPSSQKLTQPAFATLTSFGLAFLVGFSTDVFFQALDRLVNYLSQTVGKAGT